MNRRGFLASCLALAAAPAIVRADALMKIVPREAAIITFDWSEAQYDAVNQALPLWDPRAVKLYSAALFKETIKHGGFTSKFMGNAASGLPLTIVDARR